MSVELVNAILNIRTVLKRDNILKHVMMMTEIPEAVTMGILLALVWYTMKTMLLKVVSKYKSSLILYKLHIFLIMLCLFVCVCFCFNLVYFGLFFRLIYFNLGKPRWQHC